MGSSGTNKRQRKILVVGNDPDIVLSLRTMLTFAEHDVLTTHAAEVAIPLARTTHYNIGLALIDVGTAGLEPQVLAERLRSARPGIKTLFYSGLIDRGVIRLGIVDPASGALRKDGVMAAIQEALGVRAAPNETPKTMTA